MTGSSEHDLAHRGPAAILGEHEETLGSLVTHVLVHEIGHHFGLSDADMEAIEAAADERRAGTTEAPGRRA